MLMFVEGLPVPVFNMISLVGILNIHVNPKANDHGKFNSTTVRWQVFMAISGQKVKPR